MKRLQTLDIKLARAPHLTASIPQVFIHLRLFDEDAPLNGSPLLFAVIGKECDGESCWSDIRVLLDNVTVSLLRGMFDGLGFGERSMRLEPVIDTSDYWYHYQIVFSDIVSGRTVVDEYSCHASGFTGEDAAQFFELMTVLDALIGQAVVRPL